jgi:hypothetical protein
MPWTRIELAGGLARFETARGRLKYVTWIGQRSDELHEEMSKAGNDWPGGERPYYGDEASSLLAQIDEKWLGLDR